MRLGFFYFTLEFMNLITYTDEDGKKQAAYVNEQMNNPEQGIPASIPNIETLDWDGIKREIHNGLIDNGLFTWDDIQKKQTAITSILRSVLLRKIIALYRVED